MKSIHSQALAAVAVAVGLLGLSGVASATNLLVDPSFETIPVVPIGNVIPVLNQSPGLWGVENATIVTAVSEGIAPLAGTNVLRMIDNQDVTTQAVQAIDVSSFSTQINSLGGSNISMSALFNTRGPAPAAAGVALQFFTGNNYASEVPNSFVAHAIAVNTNPADWEASVVSTHIPTGTTWVLAQVYYSNASLGGLPGFVDETQVSITAVPEPGSYALLAGGLALMGLRMRRRAEEAAK
jgi:hypothetical protein